MTLELTQIAPQVQAMGQILSEQTKIKRNWIEKAKQLLKDYSTAYAPLEERIAQAEKVQEAVRFSWLGAAPAGEPLADYYKAPPPPAKVTIIASDGSQIHPDRHSLALYYLINVGAIVYQRGSGNPPATISDPYLFYRDDDLFNDQGLLIAGSMVNVKRDLAELQMLARLVPAYHTNQVQTLALIDGQFTLRIIDLPGPQQKIYQSAYLETLHTLQHNGALIAAYIDRPRSSFVLSLLHLASLETEAINEENLRHNPFYGLTDTDLFDDLPAGSRTSIFNQRAKANIAYAKDGHTIHFFYLNAGTSQNPNLARVEIPGWIAKDPEKLNCVHATLLQQAQITGGYPYVLARAHELAIITPEEREALETMLAISLRRQGLTPIVSQKQFNKGLLKSKQGFKL